jgi:hypothetical protein
MMTKPSVLLFEMKNRPTLIAAVLAVVLSFTVIDPLHIASGKHDSNPYSEIAGEINKSSTVGVLVLASYSDFYEFPVFQYLREILGNRLAYRGEVAVEYGYDEVLSQASLGEESFLRYLNSRSISHLIIPMSTVETGAVFHRWSTHGTVNLDLDSVAFSLVRESGGDFPLALYKVNSLEQSGPNEPPPSYTLEWAGVRPEFYSLLRVIDEGYKVRYLRRYEERIDTAWVFKGEQAEIILKSSKSPERVFTVELEFVAAYGDNAPPQVLRLSKGTEVKAIQLNAGEVSTAIFNVKNGESINIESVLGCRQGVAFEPNDQDSRWFCYGLRDLKVRVAN